MNWVGSLLKDLIEFSLRKRKGNQVLHEQLTRKRRLNAKLLTFFLLLISFSLLESHIPRDGHRAIGLA